MVSNDVDPGSPLSPTYFEMLMADLDINQYITPDNCWGSFNDSMWINDCPLRLSLPELPDNVGCYIDSSCLHIECCYLVPELNHAFSLSLRVDDCNYDITTSIEQLQMQRKLSLFEFGKQITFDLDGLLVLRFMVAYLDIKDSYVIDLEIQLYLQANSSATEELRILEDISIPRIPCNADSTFKDSNFSLSEWKTKMNVVNMVDITEYQVAVLLENIGISEFMLPSECSVDTNEVDKCTVEAHLPELEDSITCRFIEQCTGVQCCLQSADVPEKFDISFHIDVCTEKVTINIEKLQFTVPFQNFTWGSVQHFSLFGVIRLELEISELVERQLYSVSLNASICFNAIEPCGRNINVLQNLDFIFPPCDWTTDFIDEDFTFDLWASENGYNSTSLSETGTGLFLSYVGVSEYIQARMCDISTYPYIPTDMSGWNNECLVTDVDLEPVTEDTHCHLDDSCSGFDCCTYVSTLSRSFHTSYQLDHCKRVLSITIEKMTHQIILTTFEFDVWHHHSLNGFIQIDYLVRHLPAKQLFILSIHLAICLDKTNCAVRTSILKEAVVPNIPCEWNPDLTDTDFSLTEWKYDRQIGENDTLSISQQTELSDDIGVSHYLNDQQCSAGVVDNEATDCNPPESFPSSVCSMTDSCSGIECCVFSEVLQRYISYFFHFDECNHMLYVRIETFTKSMSLYDYTYGSAITFSLNSIFQIEFAVDHLDFYKRNIISLTIKECYGLNETCVLSTEVLNHASFPSQNCPTDKTYNNRGFSLSTWLDDNNINSSLLEDVALSRIMKDLGANQYLLATECSVQTANVTNGWINDCPLSMVLPNMTSDISCHMYDTCTAVDCCVMVEELQSSFSLVFSLRECDLVVEVGIEKLHHELLLADVIGSPTTVSLNGFLQLRFTIEEFSAEEYILDVKVQICLESGSACKEISVFEETKLQRYVCDFPPIFDNED
ncbi:uncharacterized protein LOC132726632 [Ruditapes philippinarum]|uniref:uncharacterized protein LOC132726632 n=1 Tax=Ruditapes philippinarum TaxID=129788 RepID=UPI00295BF3F6|nr:uncharacterized protein LOC132726632 [Ruditapes philippinarum]